ISNRCFLGFKPPQSEPDESSFINLGIHAILRDIEHNEVWCTWMIDYSKSHWLITLVPIRHTFRLSWPADHLQYFLSLFRTMVSVLTRRQFFYDCSRPLNRIVNSLTSLGRRNQQACLFYVGNR